MSHAMEDELNLWINSRLGIQQRIDLSGLIYHPRHGSLCRRFLKFLSESTLCKNKYPDILAKEELTEADDLLKTTEEQLAQILRDIEQRSKSIENEERELAFLRDKLEYVRSIKVLGDTVSQRFEEMSNNSNVDIQRIIEKLDEVECLENADLETLYSLPDIEKLETISSDQLSRVDEELRKIVEEIDGTHRDINQNLAMIKKFTIENQIPSLKESEFEEFEALKIIDGQDKTIEINPEEVALLHRAIDYKHKIALMKQRIHDRDNSSANHRSNPATSAREEIEKYNKILDGLIRLDSLVEETM